MAEVSEQTTDKAHLVAEWCGWRAIQGRGTLEIVWTGINPQNGEREELPEYDDLNACREFGQVAEDRGLGLHYSYQLMLLLRGHSLRPSENSTDWSTLTPEAITRLVVMATPAQRLDAIVAVLKEARE